MSASSERVRRRYRLLNAVLDDATRGGATPPRLARLGEACGEFGSVDGLLLAVHHRWWTAFEAHLDELLANPPADPVAAASALWCGLGARHDTARALLDAYAARPVLAAAEARRLATAERALGLPDGALHALRGSPAAPAVAGSSPSRLPSTPVSPAPRSRSTVSAG